MKDVLAVRTRQGNATEVDCDLVFTECPVARSAS